MSNESTTTAEIQELLAISAEYMVKGGDPVIACRARAVEPFGKRVDLDQAPQGATPLDRR